MIGELLALNSRTKQFEFLNSDGRIVAGIIDPCLIRKGTDLTIGKSYLFILDDHILIDALPVSGIVDLPHHGRTSERNGGRRSDRSEAEGDGATVVER